MSSKEPANNRHESIRIENEWNDRMTNKDKKSTRSIFSDVLSTFSLERKGRNMTRLER